MRYKLHIPFVNRSDLLADAVESLRDIGNIHVWADGVEPPELDHVTTHRLPPLPFTGVMNMIIQSSWEDDVMFFAHNDCLAAKNRAEEFLQFIYHLNEKWGLVHTHYDVLCAFNMDAVCEVGYWDTQWSQYTADCDYYHRIRLAGWPILQFGGAGIQHRNDASNTIKADSSYNRVTQFRTQFDKEYYEFKWGGPVGSEAYRAPFGDPMVPAPHDREGTAIYRRGAAVQLPQ